MFLVWAYDLRIMANEPNEDYEQPFYRLRRSLQHLWKINQGKKEFNPGGCDGCKEIHGFLTDPDYRGDEHFPVGTVIDRDRMLGPDDFEMKK
jgi:hypothetical protein